MSKRRRAVWAVAAAGLLGTAMAHAKCTAQFMELPVRMQGSRAITPMGINGTQVPFIVDSGAFYSLLTQSTAEQLGLERKASAWTAAFAKVEVGGESVQNNHFETAAAQADLAAARKAEPKIDDEVKAAGVDPAP